ncbi:MAG: bifunctional oligoribonuclease/PAP phosphatase NrnA [Actinomycetota bacterium]|nr:bifunctional oligoribonuclease/PAP phosphatase NrnA [Actinomycetota bacterium]
MKNEIERIREMIEKNRYAAIVGHQYPDGDAIGSTLGLGIMLKNKGYAVDCGWPEPFELPEKYSFLPGIENLKKPSKIVFDGLVFAIDCANPDRFEELSKHVLKASNLINIDHHPDNTRFGTINILRPDASATAEIIYTMAEGLDLQITLESALCLYTGIVTDTGRFQFSNTKSRTLRIAADIVSMGVSPSEVYRNVYQNDSLDSIHLAGEVMDNAEYIEEYSLIYATLTQKTLKKWKVSMGETEDLIDSLRTLKGHQIAALFKELKDKRIRVSLRSNSSIDIGSIARKLGGGGHAAAAGYTSDRKTLNEALDELLEEVKKIEWNSCNR